MNQLNDDPWKWLDPPDPQPEYTQAAQALYEELDNAAMAACSLAEIRRTRKTVEIKSLIDRALVLIEEEL